MSLSHFKREGVVMSLLIAHARRTLSMLFFVTLVRLYRQIAAFLRYQVARRIIRDWLIPFLFWLYRSILKSYPAGFQARYDREMLADFADLCSEHYRRAGHRALIKVAWRELYDELITLVSIDRKERLPRQVDGVSVSVKRQIWRHPFLVIILTGAVAICLAPALLSGRW
jgi:hypothetical protein